LAWNLDEKMGRPGATKVRRFRLDHLDVVVGRQNLGARRQGRLDAMAHQGHLGESHQDG
jgi:hypothetical protein